MRDCTRVLLAAALLLGVGAAGSAARAERAPTPARDPRATSDSLRAARPWRAPGAAVPGVLDFTPAGMAQDSLAARAPAAGSLAGMMKEDSSYAGEEEWLSARFGEHLLTEPEAWHSRRGRPWRLDPLVDYNRVDPLRLGITGQLQDPRTMAPRLGARIEYATGRERWLYGAQVEQPLLPRGRVAVGASVTRRTDHEELQQVDDVENSLALLLARQDYRDYFEREGLGGYVAWRVPDFSTVSLHLRSDRYRTIPLYASTRSWFLRDRPLRDNPAVDEGEAHTLLLRLERQARRPIRTRAGFYHAIELESAGGGLGGDFHYTFALADVRSVLRLSPANTVVLRVVGGHTTAGVLPEQKRFTLGGADGLRAHATAEYRGDQLLLGQAEYTAALWRLRSTSFQAGLHAIAFLDVGHAWDDPAHDWDPRRQHLRADGGVGLASAEDNLRVYVARDLQRSRSGAVVTVRMQRPF